MIVQVALYSIAFIQPLSVGPVSFLQYDIAKKSSEAAMVRSFTNLG